MKFRLKTLTALLTLLALVCSGAGCDGAAEPGNNPASQEEGSGTTHQTTPSTAPADPTKGSGYSYRGDLCWAGSSIEPSDVLGTVYGDSRTPETKSWDSRLAITVQYDLWNEDHTRMVKSFWDFTDSNEDLAFYDAEVTYFESLGIEVLKDHRCSVSTPGQTNGVVPALCVAMTSEQYNSLVPRLSNESYTLSYAQYALVAPENTPDRYDIQKSEEAWTLAEHPYRSGVVWSYQTAGDVDGYGYGEVVPWSYQTPFSPSDRLAILAVILEEGYVDVEDQLAHFRSYQIEVWDDLTTGEVTLSEDGVASVAFYLSATVAQLRQLETLSKDCTYVLYGMNYEEHLPEGVRG